MSHNPTSARPDPVFVMCEARTGSTLLRFLVDAHPDIALFVASGRLTPGLLEQLPQGTKFYPKPYRVSELVDAIKSVA